MPYRVTLDDEVMSKVHEYAEPWVDSPNSALRKAFHLDPARTSPIYFDIERIEEDDFGSGTDGVAVAGTSSPPARGVPRRRKRRVTKSSGRVRAPKGSLLDEREYWRPILQVLANSPNGAAPARDVIAQVGSMLDDKLKPLDKEELASGGLRWQTRAMFARFRMKEGGLLKHGSPRGIWEISDRGREALKDEQFLAVATD